MRKQLLSLFVAAMLCATTVSAANKAGVTKVLDYLPAPGQFVNAIPMYDAGDTKQDILDKCLTRLQENQYITLGSFGGYVVVGFDHAILNIEGNDFEVVGNAMPSSKEPGIVMVSKDENGNGLADDTWYELAGSNYAGAKNKTNFSITYQKPDAAKQALSWTNSDGESGTLQYLPCNPFIDPERKVDSNYPKWISDESITFTGTLIDYTDVAGMTWGYADLIPEKVGQTKQGNPFDLDWAVDADGNNVALKSIDFVKVYNCVSKINPPFGEVSTEVVNVIDLHPDATLPIEVATLEDLALDPESHKPGNWTAEEDEMTSFTNGSFEFKMYAMADYLTWGFFGYSNETATTYTGLTDQFRNVVGSGVDGSANYGIAYVDKMMGYSDVTLPNHSSGAVVNGFYITNTPWVEDAILNGDGMSSVAPNEGFTTGDSLVITVVGFYGEDTTNVINIPLADYRSENAAEHYYLDTWQWADLSALGTVTKIRFKMNGSKSNSYGITTPAYFAFDNFGAARPDREVTAQGVNTDTKIALNALTTLAEDGLNNKYTVIEASENATATVTDGELSVSLSDENNGYVVVCAEVKGKKDYMRIPLTYEVPTSTNEIESAKAVIYSHNQNIFVNGAEAGAPIVVYSINGTMLYNGVVSSTAEVVSVSYSGMAIVKVGNQAVKVTL